MTEQEKAFLVDLGDLLMRYEATIQSDEKMKSRGTYEPYGEPCFTIDVKGSEVIVECSYLDAEILNELNKDI